MKLLPMDLETAPTARALAAQYNPADNPPPSNYKSEEAIAGHHERGAATFADAIARTASFSPRLGRIVAIGVGEAVTVAIDERDERAMIADAMRALSGDTESRIVTFNGKAFDFRFLFIRAAILGVEVTLPCPADDYLRRYTREPHVDLLEILNGSRSEKGDSLEGWAQAFGIDTAKVGSGAEIWPAVQRGDAGFIREHCAADLSITAQLADRINAAGLLRRHQYDSL